MSSYNNQLMYRPDYSYAEALSKFNPFKNIAEPFEKMEAKKSADKKAALEASLAKATIENKSADTAGKLQDNIDKPRINQATIENKNADTAGKEIDNAYKPLTAQADIDKKSAEKAKTDKEAEFIAPKANAEIELKKAQAGKARTQSGLLVPEFLLSKEYKNKQIQKMGNEMENNDRRSEQIAYRNLRYGEYIENIGKKKKEDDNIFGD